YAATAAASYGQMKLEGLGATILFMIIAADAFAVDIALLCKAFRSRLSVIVSTVITLALAIALVSARKDVAAVFDHLTQHWQARLLGVAIVVVPLMLLAAPLIQHFELRRNRPRWVVYVAVGVQAVLIATGWTLNYFDEHPRESTLAQWKDLRTR